MRICHITYVFPPPEGGGAETHNLSLVNHLAQRGHSVDVIVVRPPHLYKTGVTEVTNSLHKGVRVHHICYQRFPWWVLKVRRKIREIEREGKIDIFDIHSASDVFAFLFQRRTLLFSLHFLELNCPGRRLDHRILPCVASFSKCWRCSGLANYARWKLVRWLVLRKVTKFVVKYDYMKKLAVESGIGEDKVEVVPFWIDIERVGEIANSPGFRIAGVSRQDRVFVHVGRIVLGKGTLRSLKALSMLTERIRKAKLILVGDGILRKDMENFCVDNHLEGKVIFAGNVSHEDVFRYLSLADCVISGQVSDNYSWTLLEYMGAGKPIIATNVGSTSEILRHGYNALLCEPTPESLSSRMQQLLENPRLAERLARNALATVRIKHGVENLRKYEELIHRLKP